MSNQRQNYRTVKMETVPVEDVEGLPTQNVPVPPSQLEQLARGGLDTAKMPLREVLNQRVAHVVQAKAEDGDAIARYNANLRYTPEIKWFEYDELNFRLLQILEKRDGALLVEAQRTSGKIWHLKIPQRTEFKNVLFRED